MITKKIIDLLGGKFLGKGVIDKHLPFLFYFFKKITYLLYKGETLVNIPSVGKFLVSNKDSGVGLYLRLHHMYEPIQTTLLSQTIKSGNVVFDIGANIGYYSVIAASSVGEEGKVIAFEPDPESIILLKKNLELNQVTDKIKIIETALGNQPSNSNFVKDKYSPGNSYVSKEKKGTSIKVNTLDNIVESLNLPSINVIKIDIEGAEISCLQGATKTFTKNKNIHLFIECNPKALQRNGESVEKLIKTLTENGFSIKNIINEYTGKTELFTNELLSHTLEKYPYTTLYAQN